MIFERLHLLLLFLQLLILHLNLLRLRFDKVPEFLELSLKI